MYKGLFETMLAWSLTQTDKLCPSTAVVNQTCTISNKDIRLTYDFEYSTDLELVFDNSAVYCVTTDNTPCSLHFKSSADISLLNGSLMSGRQVIIDAPKSVLTIADTSVITVSGQSFNTLGTTAYSGASFIGQGGSCQGSSTITYGGYNMAPDFKNISGQSGSIGDAKDKGSGGGGRVIITVDAFKLNGEAGSIQANARPFFNETDSGSQTGGSGGYIYLQSKNNYHRNSISSASSIEANGGSAKLSGAGGVVVIEGLMVPPHQVFAAGGHTLGEPSCGNGAAGTLFYADKTLLIIDNHAVPTTRLTTIKPVQNLKVINSMVIFDAAQTLSFNELWVDSSTLIVQSRLITFSAQTTIGPSTVLDLTLVPTAMVQADALAISNLQFQKLISFKVTDLTIAGTITSQVKDSQVIVDSEDFKLLGSIQADKVFINGNDSVWIGGSVQSNIPNSCAETDDPSLFTCVPIKKYEATSYIESFNTRFKSNAVSVLNTQAQVNEGFQIYIRSGQVIFIQNGSVKGPRLGLCAPDVKMTGSILDAAARGCTIDNGFGKGIDSDNCSGQGGAYGGNGGSGLNYTDLQPCQPNSNVYFHESEARFEGSSGASNNSVTGGSGGGIIWLSASNTVDLQNSTIDVSGENGENSNHYGNGGGSGGSIQVIATNIEGDGLIKLRGGDGSGSGGGGGSGGRLVVALLQSYNASNAELQSQKWSGTINLDGGIGGPVQNAVGVKAQDGQFGKATQTECFGGYSGPFCSPCPIGTFKYDFGYGVCQPCENKPKTAYYDQIAESQIKCSYQCSEGLEPVEVNSECVSSILLQYQRVGGWYGFIVLTFCYCFATVMLWIMIVMRSQYKIEKTDQKTVMLSSEVYSISETHTSRMYLLGDNSIEFPWYLPKDFSRDCMASESKDKFIEFIKHQQGDLTWTSCQKYSSYIISFVFPCFADSCRRSIRRKHFNSLQHRLVQSFGQEVRLQADDEFTLAYIDFQKECRDQLPMTLVLGGNGSLETPYNLNYLDDEYPQQLLNPKQVYHLTPFIKNLNTLLGQLCFYKFHEHTVWDLRKILEWLDIGNKQIFRPRGIKVLLYVFENSYQVHNGRFRQRRRSMPIEQSTFEAFPAMFLKLIQFVQLKRAQNKSEIKLGVVFQKDSGVENSHQIGKIKFDQDCGLEFSKTTITQLYEAQSTKDLYDTSKRAFDTSLEATQALETVLLKDQGRCHKLGYKVALRVYSTWIWALKYHSLPAESCINLWLLGFALSMSYEILAGVFFLLYLVNPWTNLVNFGATYLLILPGLPILTPLVGLLATVRGSASLLKMFGQMNAALVLFNYPLTMVALVTYRSQEVYNQLIGTLIINKIVLSFFGARVRHSFENPLFTKTSQKIAEACGQTLI